MRVERRDAAIAARTAARRAARASRTDGDRNRCDSGQIDDSQNGFASPAARSCGSSRVAAATTAAACREHERTKRADRFGIGARRRQHLHTQEPAAHFSRERGAQRIPLDGAMPDTVDVACKQVVVVKHGIVAQTREVEVAGRRWNIDRPPFAIAELGRRRRGEGDVVRVRPRRQDPCTGHADVAAEDDLGVPSRQQFPADQRCKRMVEQRIRTETESVDVNLPRVRGPGPEPEPHLRHDAAGRDERSVLPQHIAVHRARQVGAGQRRADVQRQRLRDHLCRRVGPDSVVERQAACRRQPFEFSRQRVELTGIEVAARERRRRVRL